MVLVLEQEERMTLVHIDFETRARRDLRKCGVRKYVACPDFRVLCVSFAVENSKVYSAGPIDDVAYAAEWGMLAAMAEDPEYIFVAHNASFEMTVWNNYLAKIDYIPEIPINRWRCTAAAAAYRNLPRDLERVGEALGLPYKKDMAGAAVMMKMCKPIPESYTKVREEIGDWYESDADFETLMSYCDMDVEVERAVEQRIGLLPPDLQREWQLDQEINQRGIHVDLELADGIMELKEKLKKELKAECMEKFGFSPSQVEKIKDELRYRDIPIPRKRDGKTGKMKETLDGNAIKGLLVDPGIPGDIKHLLTLRRDFGTTSLAKVNAVLNYEIDGYIYDQFLFHGASTGRWAGKGIQLHNLPRGSLNEEIAEADMRILCQLIKARDLDTLVELYPGIRTMELLKTAIRGLIVPRPSKKLVVMDFSQIESRVLAWLAGHEEKLDIFRSGKDVYKYNACAVYGKEYDEITKPERSGGGKVSELACGYQGGKNAIKSMGVNIGLHVTDEEAEEIKNNWRAGNQEIVNFWYSLQDAAIRAVLKGKCMKVRDIRFKVVDGWLACRLPSGRKLWYYDPLVKTVETDWGPKQQLTYMGMDQYTNKWKRLSIYGGRWAENITQAVARDLLAHSMMTGYERGFSQILHVHDEAGFEVPENDMIGLTLVKNFMEDTPPWADGCPVGAAGYESNRYRKD